MSLYPSFWMQAQWGARVETPEALADRFLQTIDAVQPLNSLFKTWTWGDMPEVWETEGRGGSYPFSEIRPDLVGAPLSETQTPVRKRYRTPSTVISWP